MIRPLSILMIGLASVLVARPASAQRSPVPNSGMVAIGASIGASVPTDGRLSSGFALGAQLERYLTPRVSIRGQFGGTWQDFVGQNFTGKVKPIYIDANVVYNWEGGVIHPYVTGGVAAYRYAYEQNGRSGSDTSPGIDVGGGLEYFVRRHTTFTVEALYHRVGDITTALAPFQDHGFWTGAVGVKKYF